MLAETILLEYPAPMPVTVSAFVKHTMLVAPGTLAEAQFAESDHTKSPPPPVQKVVCAWINGASIKTAGKIAKTGSREYFVFIGKFLVQLGIAGLDQREKAKPLGCFYLQVNV
jgi:hypothetical protein